MTLFGISVIVGEIRIRRSHADTQVGSESESYKKKKEGCVKTKAEITVLGLQSKKHQGLIAGSHPEVGERRGVASPQSLQRDPPLPVP